MINSEYIVKEKIYPLSIEYFEDISQYLKFNGETNIDNIEIDIVNKLEKKWLNYCNLNIDNISNSELVEYKYLYNNAIFNESVLSLTNISTINSSSYIYNDSNIAFINTIFFIEHHPNSNHTKYMIIKKTHDSYILFTNFKDLDKQKLKLNRKLKVIKEDCIKIVINIPNNYSKNVYNYNQEFQIGFNLQSKTVLFTTGEL
jgi:hypothetical protein